MEILVRTYMACHHYFSDCLAEGTRLHGNLEVGVHQYVARTIGLEGFGYGCIAHILEATALYFLRGDVSVGNRLIGHHEIGFIDALHMSGHVDGDGGRSS